MPKRCAGRNTGSLGGFTHGDMLDATLFDDLYRRGNESLNEVSMMIASGMRVRCRPVCVHVGHLAWRRNVNADYFIAP